ncbi:MAG: type II toxin-antitoxin system RatA family toxin [Burkholderiaceae bacterium]
MAEVVKTVLVPYSAQEMFDLVSDVGAYPDFLPWCGGTSVEPQTDGSRLEQVQIAFKGLRQSFTTRNRHIPGERIDMTLHEGPFKALTGAWVFIPLNERACKVSFSLSYHFSSKILEKLVGPVFEQITTSFVDAFVQRADALHGPELGSR